MELRVPISPSRAVRVVCAEDFTGSVHIQWEECTGPAPAIAGAFLQPPRPTELRNVVMPIRWLTRGFDGCYTLQLHEDLPQHIGLAVVAALAKAQVQAELRKVLEG